MKFWLVMLERLEESYPYCAEYDDVKVKWPFADRADAVFAGAALLESTDERLAGFRIDVEVEETDCPQVNGDGR